MSATGMSGDQWLDTQLGAMNALLASGRAPLLAKLLGRLGPEGYDFDLDRLFEFGLQALLGGLGIGNERPAPGGGSAGQQADR